MHEEESRLTPSKEDAERDATSKETVNDLKESGGEKNAPSSTPSPDGQFDTPRDHGDEAGPM